MGRRAHQQALCVGCGWTIVVSVVVPVRLAVSSLPLLAISCTLS